MISDLLFEALEEIRGYQKEINTYDGLEPELEDQKKLCIPKTRFAEISMAWVNERRNRMTVRARRALKLGNGSLGHGSAD